MLEFDECPDDPEKTTAGQCGCGVPDTDSDADGVADCNDACLDDPLKTVPGLCGCGIPDIDWDADGVPACVDNCVFDHAGSPSFPNPDQLDFDLDGTGDVCDICPSDVTNTCDPDRSTGESINSDGGSIETADGSVEITIPPGAVDNDTSVSITDGGMDFELVTNAGSGMALFGITALPEGQTFNVPVEITLSWPDAENDGLVDGTYPAIKEDRLLITKDAAVVTDICKSDPGCNRTANTFTVTVDSFSEFALVIVDDIGPATTDVAATPNPVEVSVPITVTALVDDSDDAGSFVDSAEMSTDGGPYVDMASADGAFDSPTEIVTSPLPAFEEAGLHTICVRGYDVYRNAAGLEDCLILAVYDPNGGFVTGGGWIHSPEGAVPETTIAGKATFGFVSKYKKYATVPTGQTGFRFRLANLDFHSESYEWLVITGTSAKYKGSGTINGEGSYKFMLTGVDADLNVHDAFEVDRFRIKIWREADGIEYLVYDNALGDDSDEATTEIGGGSIVIHKEK